MTSSNASAAKILNEKELLSYCNLASRLNFGAHKKTQNLLFGQKMSRAHGRGLDYQESRIYNSGDDIRAMDWKVSARTNQPHIKLFEEAKARPSYLFMDFNSTMFFGTKTQLKISLAAKLACALGAAAIQNNDSLGYLSFGSDGIHIEKPQLGKKALFQLIRHIMKSVEENWQLVLQTEAPPPCLLSEALQKFAMVAPTGSFIIIFSDLHHLDAESKKQLALLKRHHEIMVFYLADPFELSVPKSGYYGLAHSHSFINNTYNSSAILNTKEQKIQRLLQDLQLKKRADIEANISQLKIPVLPFQTDWIILEQLKKQLAYPTMAYKNWLQGLS